MRYPSAAMEKADHSALDGSNPDWHHIFDFFPTPTLVVSPSHRIQTASAGLLKAWKRGRGEFVGNDIFTALYQGSPTERFDRIPFAYTIERAVSARALRLCHAAYVADGVSWTARIIPVFRDDELLCLVLEWEQVELHSPMAGDELVQSWLPTDDAFRLLVQAVKDYAIFLLDTRGNVTTWNAGAELNKGYKKEEIVGKHFSLFYGEDDIRSRKPERELEVCLRQGRVEDEGWRYRKDGSRFWANVVITAVYRKGVHVGFGKVTRNLSERKEAELRLIAAYEESTQLKNNFMANMSHEIRTPMHGMLSACALLLDTPLTPEQRETANIIEESGQILLQIINNILDYSKLAAGSFPISKDTVDVACIINLVVHSVQTTLQPGVTLSQVIPPDLPKVAEGDPLRYRQIVHNIVSNAGKFTDKGSISVRASVRAEDESTYVILTEVTDTGTGVSADAAHKLFQPFTQLDTTYQKRHQGTGLGLSIAKSLAELMGGKIGYRQNPGSQGSIFWFTVKLNKHKNSPESHAAKAESDTSGQLPKQRTPQADDRDGALRRMRAIAPTKRVLAAEANIINQKVLIGMLHAFGFKQITVVPNGSQAVSTLFAAPDAYDLVFMDVSMPVMDGFQATTRIRRGGMRLPIIAMTAHGLKGDRESCLEKGMDDYIAKPVNMQLLLKMLLKWLVAPSRPALANSGPGEASNSLNARSTP
jgi:osomolarity two-component system sensor histidine kinase TcsA